jgi:hypothetical protein
MIVNERQKHDYTSELELKSLLIRVKNKRLKKDLDQSKNKQINRYIRWFNVLNDLKTTQIQKKNRIKNLIKTRIVLLSEQTIIDNKSYERFGEIVLLMIKNILRKPQFSGYTFKDEFYSDSINKILKYLNNFDHTLISERSGLNVNAFAYISQIIHNSILYVINIRKKEHQNIMKNRVHFSQLDDEYNIKVNTEEIIITDYYPEDYRKKVEEIIELYDISSLVDEVKKIDSSKFDKVRVIYPSSYRITFDEYNELKRYLNGKIDIIRRQK